MVYTFMFCLALEHRRISPRPLLLLSVITRAFGSHFSWQAQKFDSLFVDNAFLSGCMLVARTGRVGGMGRFSGKSRRFSDQPFQGDESEKQQERGGMVPEPRFADPRRDEKA